MPKLWICFRGQRMFQPFDPLRHVTQAFGVALRIAATGFVGDDGEAFAESGGEID